MPSDFWKGLLFGTVLSVCLWGGLIFGVYRFFIKPHIKAVVK